MVEHVAETSYLGYIGIFILLFAGQLLYLRKRIWNLFDPLILILINVSLNATIIFILFFNGQVGFSIALYILIGTLLFSLGLNSKRIKIWKTVNERKKAFGLSPKVTVLFIVVSLTYQIIAIGFMFKQIGFGILTGNVNPDLVKVSLTQDGMGIFRHIGVAGELLFIPLVAHAFFSYKMRRLATVCVIFYALKFLVFPMSKSGLVFLVFDLGILMHFYEKKFNYTILKTKKLLLIAAAGLIPAFIVLINISSTYETTIPAMLVERFIVTGYGTYQYFVSGGIFLFENLSVLEKTNYYFDTILSMLKIKEWEEMSYMAQMGYQLTGAYMPGFGPNPYLFLDGHFLFGWAGVIYCYAVGALIAFARSSTVNILIFYILVKMSAYFVADPAIAQAQLFALLLYLPVALLLYLGAKSTNTQINFDLMNIFSDKKAVCEKV